ncbi:hypothetical protein [Actinomyces glycerinitolerans]|uniref:Uncharacterized protein n=1 Tax=Actinomyces glycerinitolerans TaxID=1892869 RepID=A0A1M4RYG0_9ACTO|nr:hypothetical protein [Actinomyces glycerinitolerans]SHE24940.1 Hypothetical protein ACGLYG10_1152 [Actinomyces glycerinitolerans]
MRTPSRDDVAATATPPRRRSTEILRGLRAGGLLTALTAAAWAWWQTAHYNGTFQLSEDVRNLALGGGLILVAAACCVWLLLAPATSQTKRRRALVRALVPAVLFAAASLLFCWTWWRESQDIQMSYPVLAQLAVAAAGLAVAAGSDLQLRRTGPHTPKAPARAEQHPHTTTIATGAAAAPLAAAVIALTIPSLMYAPTSVQVAATEPAPIPETLTDEVRWERVIEYDRDDDIKGVIAGAAGPIVVTKHGAMGLAPDTGETTWSYTRPADLDSIGRDCNTREQAYCTAVLTPDRTRLIMGYGYHPLETEFVVLNTFTGEVVFEHVYRDLSKLEENRGRPWIYWYPSVQVTDHVLVVEQEVLSLTDGSLLRTLPDERAPKLNLGNRSECPRDDSPRCGGYLPPSRAGHSTLILGITCWSPDNDPENYVDYPWCEMEVAPDSDPSAVSTASGIVPPDPDRWESDSVVVDGWTVRYADPDAAYEELSRHNLMEEATSLSFPLEAVSLDALAGVDDAEPVALGSLNRPEHYEGAHTLALLGAAGPNETATVQTWFDPVTRQAFTRDDIDAHPSGPGYLDSLRPTKSRTNDSIDLLHPDDTIAMHVDYPNQQEILDYESEYPPYLVQAPGTVAIVDHCSIWRTDTNDPAPTGYETVIYGVG